MCGIVCLWNVENAASIASSMIDAIAHRGPDDRQVRQIAGTPATLGHCRLAIIGPDNGRQPLEDHGHTLVANGEIYNHAGLRAALGPDRFRTDSDSETILHLFRDAHPRWIAALDGMYAFVLVTPKRLVAARDPLGIKPLYVGTLNGGTVVASELKAFDTFAVDDVHALSPGCVYDSDAGIRSWYRMPAGAADLDTDEDPAATAAELRRVLEAAVARWSVADVEVGCLLSGGLDSSILAALAARQQRHPLKTFSVGLAGSADLAAASRVATHIGAEHREYRFDADDVRDVLSDVIYHLESDDVDLVRSAVPTWFVARLARRFVKTVLTGEGADELFAGYAYHQDYLGRPRDLADELTRSLGTMHNINLQRVDRVTMAHGLEARTPFLDQELIGFAQSIPARWKLATTADPAGAPIEKWILRRAVEDLLPAEIVWRTKSQFDEGSGATVALRRAIERDRDETSANGARIDRDTEGRHYTCMLERRFKHPERVRANAGQWVSARISA